jgi:2,4-dienoyl-CoA reductase-like NADH-dependent reductase (Old Yellow Enzyme family)
MAEVNVTDSRTSGESSRRILRRDPNPHLFRPIKFRSIESRNRIMVSPMCQYSASDGLTNDWHFVHLGERAVGGAGIVFTESVHVEPRGRITPHCLGLWNDEQMTGLRRIAKFVSEQGAIPGIQLGHAGRKASVGRPWDGARPISVEEGGWTTISPSDRPYARDWSVPEPMTDAMIQGSIDKFATAVRRAAECGFKVLEVHAAHGYLLHQFMSPLSNSRDDDYGGSFENRVRLTLETIRAAREEWPAELPIFIRVSVTDWVDGGWSIDDSVRLVRLLREENLVDLVDCSSGGNDPRQEIPIHPGYQVPFAAQVRAQCDVPTGAVGLVHSPDLAESIVANGSADIVILGRAMLSDPMWPLRAANTLGAKNVAWPRQYERGNIFS